MRGKRCAAWTFGVLPAFLLGAGAAAEDVPPSPIPRPSAAILVLDGSSSMNDKFGEASKLETARTELGKAVGDYADRLSFGLVAFGHRKASNCADSQVLAEPGTMTPDTQSNLLDIKAKGQAPIAAALSDAARAAGDSGGKSDVILIADGGDSCDADICVTADALKQQSPGLRIHVVALAPKEEELKPLTCVAAATGGEFAAAADADAFKQGLAAVLEAVATPASGPEAVAGQTGAIPAEAALPAGVSVMGTSESVPAEVQAAAPGQSAVRKSGPAPSPMPSHSGETAVNKSEAPAQDTAVAAVEPEAKPPPQPARPVPVTLKAMVTEVGPKLQSGLTWRVFAAQASTDGNYKLVSTHREAMPTAALPPGDYLVNAAYGLSNLTKKIKVEGGRSIEETFVLNTGGLKLAAVLAEGEVPPEHSVRFDILTDEEDQFGNRRTILANADPGVTFRLNAGAYHIVSVFGDANASVKADVTVEPGKVTEATLKHSGAKTTFRLVQTLGGEALADTKWTILTSAGDIVKENAGALPTHILAPGSYAVVADHNGLSYTRKFSIEPGQAKQIEVAVDDGPTSAGAVKALMDPPESEPTSGETVAGEGAPGTALGFDGFSARPADPNAPLINPGALFRPSAQ